jgi:hypothetical protein
MDVLPIRRLESYSIRQLFSRAGPPILFLPNGLGCARALYFLLAPFLLLVSLLLLLLLTLLLLVHIPYSRP